MMMACFCVILKFKKKTLSDSKFSGSASTKREGERGGRANGACITILPIFFTFCAVRTAGRVYVIGYTLSQLILN